ncbi:MAG: efflux RND transporter periplasmic adaptor subunit [Terriglobia bacterium]|nr:efflux RND transporter periplasmic adaptor subunit [Terriglobia bacterium]
MFRRELFYLAIGASLTLAGCSGSEPTAASAAPPPVKAETAVLPANTTAQPSDEYHVSGPLVVEHEVDVEAQREGIVSKILADVGTRLRKGQVLAELDNRELLANRDVAADKVKAIEADQKNWAAELDMDKADLTRAEAMWNASLITKEQVEHARAKVVSAKFEVEREINHAQTARDELRAIEIELDKTRILAPFDGVVARRYIRLGQKVAVNDRMFWVTETSPMNVRFTLPQEFVGKVKVGDAVGVFSPDEPNHKYAATIMLLSPVVDPASGTIDVEARVAEPAGNLRPGMTVTVAVKRAQ